MKRPLVFRALFGAGAPIAIGTFVVTRNVAIMAIFGIIMLITAIIMIHTRVMKRLFAATA